MRQLTCTALLLALPSGAQQQLQHLRLLRVGHRRAHAALRRPVSNAGDHLVQGLWQREGQG